MNIFTIALFAAGLVLLTRSSWQLGVWHIEGWRSRAIAVLLMLPLVANWLIMRTITGADGEVIQNYAVVGTLGILAVYLITFLLVLYLLLRSQMTTASNTDDEG